MDITLEPGHYVVAVSGGVDSMALLDLLMQQGGNLLTVAHFDHGMRPDSVLDRQLVQKAATRYGLPFVYHREELGPGASEDVARQARYAFLQRVREACGAQAIVTAHHQDDVLETAVMNLLRGTGPRGLVALRSRGAIQRPLLRTPKSDLIAYAKDQGLPWREDSTNRELHHFRNYIRHRIMPRMNSAKRQELLRHIDTIEKSRAALRIELTNHLHMHPGISQLDRQWFVMLSHTVAREVLATWLRRGKVKDVSRAMLERLTTAAKTATPGRQIDVDKTHIFQINKQYLALHDRER
jgi:tRNA(Ile)-lysidine synthase